MIGSGTTGALMERGDKWLAMIDRLLKVAAMLKALRELLLDL
jgi:hypothetical protein